MSEDKCPVCGMNDYTLVSPEVEFFYVQGCRGPCTLNVCLNCGTIYLPKDRLEETRKFHDQT